MATLSAVPFSALPVTDDGYTLLNDNGIVHRSSKKLSELVGDKTSSFLTKEQGDSLYQEKGDYLVEDDITGKLDKEQYANDSATFLTAHQSLEGYATQDWVEEQNYISSVDLTNYYTKSETSGANEISAALDGKEDKVFVAEYGVTTYAEIKDAYDAGKQIICKYVQNESQTKYLSLSQFVKPANIFIFTDWATLGESIYLHFTLNPDGNTGYQVISENYYAIKETSGRNELTNAFNTKQDKLTFAGTNNTITSINNSAVVGGTSYKDGYLISIDNSHKLNFINYYCSADSAKYNVAIGYYTTAVGSASVAMGRSTSAFGNYSHSEGDQTRASGVYSHAEGTYTTANGDYAHTEGYYTSASNSGAHAEGDWTKACGEGSHAEGTYTTANGRYSHAEGYFTSANGQASHAEGNYTKAIGDYSLAVGESTSAKGNYSFVGGASTVANYSHQFVIGKYNGNKENTLFEVGNGDYNNRTNALEVYKDGKVSGGDFVAGGVSLSSLTPVTLTFRTVGE